MSKSNPNESSYILLIDGPEVIRKKISRAVTDSESIVRYDWIAKPAVSNLIEIYAVCSGDAVADIEKRYEGMGYGTFKQDLADVIIQKIVPIQEKYREIVDSAELIRILREGAAKATETANETLVNVKKAMGLVTF